MESSRTHLKVPGHGLEGQVLGLEAYNSSKMSYPRLEDSTFFDSLKMGRDLLFTFLGNRQKLRGNFWKTFFSGERLNFRGKSASPRAKSFIVFCFFLRSPEKKF